LKKKRNDKDVDGANDAIISRHFTVDPNTGVPFALSPVLSFPSSITEREEEEDKEDKEDKEEKEVVEEENPLYKGYYCPRAEHRKCEDTDSPEKYHGVDAWTIDETFSGVSPPENVPQSAMFEASRAPSSWYTLGLREGEGEHMLREVLRQRRRGGVVGGGSGGGGDDDDDDDDEWWMRTHENAEALYEEEEEETSSSAVSSRNRKVEDAFNGAMRVLRFHDPDLERVRRSTKYKNVKHRGEEAMRAMIEEGFGKVKVVLREFLEKLSSSIEKKSPMEVYIELIQIGNCFRAIGELGDADYATDAFELALIARSIARTPNVEVYLFYGEFKMNLNELPAAKALLQEGLKHDSRNQPIYFALGNVCAYQGQWDEAIAAFGKAVEILPGHARSREALEAAKKHAVGSNRRMYAALCLLLLAVLGCSMMITFLMSNGSSYSDSGSKEKKAKESKKRK
jgi:tetratricopeptide (TPR) repeat protein